MRWDVFMAVVLPGFGVGYVWLIHLARHDSPLYFEIERTLRRRLPVFMGLIFLPLLWGGIGLQGRERWMVLGSGVILATLYLVLVLSFPFFRRITTLPRQQHDQQEWQATQETRPPGRRVR